MQTRASRLELSVSLPTWADEPGRPPSWSEMRTLAQQTEDIGVDAIFVADQTGFDRAGQPGTEFWDGWTLLPALAEVTRRVAIGPLVAVASLRHPILLARMAAALDDVCGGRLILGLGASGAGGDRAWRMLGTDTTRLYSRFAESLEILVPLLRQGQVDFAGEHFAAHQARLGPAGPRGAIPIWIGATGPKMLRLAARWADAVNFGTPLSTPEAAADMVRQFDGLCREVGRDPTSVRKTGWALVAPGAPEPATASTEDEGAFPVLRGEVKELAARFAVLHAAGIDHVSCYIYPDDAPAAGSTFPVTTQRGLERFAPVITELRRLEAAGPKV